jgi:hypothetical protein
MLTQDTVGNVVEQRAVLSEVEQVRRGQELLQMILVDSPANPVTSTVQGQDLAVVVRHTFIEVVPPRKPLMSRSMSDSALLDCQSDFEKPWDSEKPWKMRLADKFQDMSDASTNVSLEAEDFGYLNERPERKDTCWSDDEGVLDMMPQPAWSYECMGTWWTFGGSPDAVCHMLPDGSFNDGSFNEFNQLQWEGHNLDVGDFQDAATHEWRTTVMLRNMPNNYTREMLLDLVDSMGFAGTYDFAYLPVDFKSQAGLGYAFVNFTSSTDALKCFETFEGFSDWTVPSEKICTVTWGSPYQGLEAHIERYQNSPVMHHSIPDEWKPVLLKQGVRFPFPPPTKQIKTPKVRQQPPKGQSEC